MLKAHGINYAYESFRIPYEPLRKVKHYTPDFVLLSNGIVVESKGRFLTDDRQKHKAIKAQYPGLDLRFVFSNSKAKIGKKSKTTYAMWCEQNLFRYADRTIPAEWLSAAPNRTSLAVISQFLKGR